MRLFRKVLRVTTLAVALVATAACDRSTSTTAPAPSPSRAPSATESAAVSAPSAGSLSVAKSVPERVVAIGDLHGDVESARRALRLAGAIDDKDTWIGGKLVVVQTGDEIDRGDDDRRVLDLFEKLKTDAEHAGGQVVALLGNHEVMNAQVDFRYVTRGAFAAFADVNPTDDRTARATADLEAAQRGRASAFLPGGPYARMLARRPVVARVGDSIFVHGGVLPKHVKIGLDAINDGASAWLRGDKSTPPRELVSEDGPLWSRMYSAAPGREECALLVEALAALHAKRMVMGHTVQKPDIGPACDEKAWRIDVGLAKYYGGPIEVLELKGDSVKVLKGPT